jgi:protein TonB
MFADSLLEISWAERGRRGWTTLTSFGFLAIVIGLTLTIPLLESVGLPAGRVLQPPVSWGGPPPALRPVERQHVMPLAQSNLADNIVVAPRSIPRHVAMIDEIAPPPQLSYNTTPGVDGGTGNGLDNGIWKSINDSIAHVAPVPTVPPAPVTRAFRTSYMLQGSLIRRVEPVYPPMAKIAHVQGVVVLEAIISKDGTMQKLRLISGHPMLVKAAMDAVSQWRYKPYILNGDAIEVETQITVNFILTGN